MPTRTDVPVNPAHVSERLKERKIIATIFAGEEQKKWQGLFKEIFKPSSARNLWVVRLRAACHAGGRERAIRHQGPSEEMR